MNEAQRVRNFLTKATLLATALIDVPAGAYALIDVLQDGSLSTVGEAAIGLALVATVFNFTTLFMMRRGWVGPREE